MEESRPHKHRFYETTWGVLLLAGGVLIVFLLVVCGFQVFYYYKKIQLGQIPREFSGHFTAGRITPPPKPREKLAASAADDPSFGPKDSPLQIIEFSDFECPSSAEVSSGVREMMLKYPDGFNFIFRDFPLSDIHPNAPLAAEAANCAADQGRFWQMHDKLFQNQTRLGEFDLRLYALQIGLDMVKFNQCFDGGKYKEEIEIDIADGTAAGVRGTPTFFINGVKVEGAIPKETLEKVILGVK